MKIVFEPDSIHESKMGSITGVIYFHFDKVGQFPVRGWNDFVVVVAGWWLVAYDELARGANEVEFCFMDGPYKIRALSKNNHEIMLQCIEDREISVLVYEINTDLGTLEHSFKSLARSILTSCEVEGLKSSDIQSLKDYLHR